MDERLRDLNRLYGELQAAAKQALSSDRTAQRIHDLVIWALHFLADACSQQQLTSLVEDKRYLSFARADKADVLSRPTNVAFFTLNPDLVSTHWQAWWQGELKAAHLPRMLYTIVLAPCLAMELFDRQNKKQPATYFEYLVGHIFAKAIGIEPSKRANLKVGRHPIRMTMDFLFDMGKRSRRIHLPVKMSTRERVVQAWAHQRLLDKAFGHNSYRGIMILFSETKLDVRRREVVEICVPDQWLAYQALLSKMDRIYYFDVPNVYRSLAARYPKLMPIKQFSEFFSEKAAVLRS